MIWGGSEGATFRIEQIAHLLQPNVFNMGTDGFHQSNQMMCRITISPLEQFLSASFILDYIRRQIRQDMQNQQRPNNIVSDSG